MKVKLTKGKVYCIASAIIIFGVYIIQRVLSLTIKPTKELVIAEAIVFTALVAVVYFFITKSNDCFYGILMAIFGVRMMPPDIIHLEQISPDANIIYYIVKNVSVVIFLLALLKLYRKQSFPKYVTPVPIICTLAVVPFINEIQSVVGSYLENRMDTMIYSYFAGFAIYTAAMIVLLAAAMYSNIGGAKLICDFQIVALALNIGRRIVAIVITSVIRGNHISRSYYCWIAIYAFFALAFLILRKKKLKSNNS
ncbi:MAG: hypothetical protein NC213_08865 [Acetobacter sp.]|nr:hypothetical protein [Bacteroides sp.]MCM1341840.1 hypothetical protein [Acetobacter sp.]MCM1434006.1 hypothetical protein [Clostridiales bacterium]